MIIKCLYKRSCIFLGTLVLSATTVAFAALDFVDDTDLIQMEKCPYDSVAYVFSRLQDSVNVWNGCLRTTGGALNPEKCSCYLIRFVWRSDGSWRNGKKNERSQKIQVVDCNGIGHDSAQLEHNEAIGAVGCLQRPDGAMNEEFDCCKKMLDSWIGRVKGGQLSRKLLWIVFKSKIWKSISYRLSVTTFTKDQGDDIVKKFYGGLLPLMGISRSFPKVYRFASGKFYGLELPHPYI